jgi:hypothetical protein
MPSMHSEARSDVVVLKSVLRICIHVQPEGALSTCVAPLLRT